MTTSLSLPRHKSPESSKGVRVSTQQRGKQQGLFSSCCSKRPLYKQTRRQMNTHRVPSFRKILAETHSPVRAAFWGQTCLSGQRALRYFSPETVSGRRSSPTPNRRKKGILICVILVCMPRPWDFFIRDKAVLLFLSSNQSFGLRRTCLEKVFFSTS